MDKAIEFPGAQGQQLAGVLDLPDGQPPRAMVLFAHCFSCSKDFATSRVVARTLAAEGYGVLRFDFTGLGASEGAFEDTNFSTNLADLESAAHWLASEYEAPSLLVGHSLGGAAVVAVASRLDSVKAVATIGAPSDADHVIHNFGSRLDEIEEHGEAEVNLAGRPFKIKQQFVEDVSGAKVREAAANLDRALLVLHSPLDQVVGIENASGLFAAAKHPKSFVSLGQADHLLTRKADAEYAANMIAAWSAGYVDQPAPVAASGSSDGRVTVSETGNGDFQNLVVAGRHQFLADEPLSVGGDDTGPTPYDLLLAGLGACTAMTLRMYAARKKWPLDQVSVSLSHSKDYATDCVDCDPKSRIDVFERTITINGDLDDAQRERLLEIADKCPVHRTLEAKAAVRTQLA
ncbi:MAG: bifunctional alpha/beta hydrolase/OsmC family protein [Hyphomonadaceae bacterium]